MRISDWSSDVCSSDLSALCAACGARQDWYGPMGEGRACAACGAPALRPDIVFFGEMPYAMDRIERALAAADLFVSIGTSGAEIGRAHVCTPVTNAQLVCRLLLEKKTHNKTRQPHY